MTNPDEMSPNGINLLKSFERCVLHPYNDGYGYMTIGWGHLIKPGEHFTTITQQQADDMFIEDIKPYETTVSYSVQVPINQNQFDALVDFTYNEGQGGFLHSSVLEFLNKKQYQTAADALTMYNKVHVNGKLVTSNGLTKRRAAERGLFLS